MNFTNNVLLNLFRFILRIVFVKVLNEVYLGVNGLLSNVLGILALSELGIGTAINFSLYKPLASKDEKKINSLMRFYKKAYMIISLVVLVLGLGLLPFLDFFIKDSSGIEHLNIIYLIFLANMVIGYLFSYKRTLIIADQKNYKIMPIIIFCNFLMTISQIVVLLIFKNYFIYLFVQTLCILLENILVNNYISKNYVYLKDINKADKIDKEELGVIKKNIKALMFHKIGGYAVTSTDNLIISKFVGLGMVGLYSNYCLILNTISSIIYVFINNVISSFGNLIVDSKPGKRLEVFNEMNYIYYIMYAISFVCFINLFNPFIELSFGSKFILSYDVVILIVVNFYILGMTVILDAVKSAAGLYDNDKYIPFIQAVLNIVISIVLAIKIGLVGVFIGTFVSTLVPLIIKPIIIYKHIFECDAKVYFINFLKQLFVLGICLIISIGILKVLVVENLVLDILVRLIVSLLSSSLVLLLFTYRSREFSSLVVRVKNLVRKGD